MASPGRRIVLCICLSVLGSCFARREPFEIRHHLGTKSRYVDAVAAQGGLGQVKPPATCKLVHINYLGRHGIRNPTPKAAQDIVPFIKSFKEKARNNRNAPYWIDHYDPPFKGECGRLVKVGREEAQEIGKRFKKRFPEIFGLPYNTTKITFLSSRIERAKETGKAFFEGIYGPEQEVVMEARPEKTSQLLRFHVMCKKYMDTLSAKLETIREATNPVYAKVQRGVHRRYGLDFSIDDIKNLWALCTFQVALKDDGKKACAMFTRAEVLLLEWIEDVTQWVEKAYYEPLNYQMGRDLMKDIVDSMTRAVNEKGNREVARMRFAHAETVIPTASMLGLFKEAQPDRQMLPPPDEPRQWRSTVVSPFAANEALLLYQCQARGSEDWKVLALHNEKPMVMPGCGEGQFFCDLETFKREIAQPILEKSFEEVCGAPPIPEDVSSGQAGEHASDFDGTLVTVA